MVNSAHIIALKTYGTQTKKGRSTLKISYTNAVSKVILAIIPQAQNVSSNRDSYVYIRIPNKPKLRHGWLFVTISDTQLTRVENIVMTYSSSAGVLCWTNDAWMLLPCRDNPTYHAPISSYSEPVVNPQGYPKVDATDPQAGQVSTDKIMAEYSKLKPNKPAWWWIPGNDATREKLTALKRAGCRWKRSRGAFAYIGDQLPQKLLALLDNADECRAIMSGMTPEEAKQSVTSNKQSIQPLPPIQTVISTILRDQIATINTDDTYPMLITQDDLVAGQDTIGFDNPQRVWFLSGNLSITQLQSVKTTQARWSQLTRRWLFEDSAEIDALDTFLKTVNIRNHVTPDSNVTDPCSLEEATAVLGVGIASVSTPHHAQTTAVKPTCSCQDHDGPVGWIPAKNLGTWVACGVCNPNGTQMPQANVDDPDADKPPAVRIIRATKLSEDTGQEDGISSAIRTISKLPAVSKPPATVVMQSKKQQSIPQEAVGELTGSVVANVYCYGYARHDGKLIYLNMGGPRSGVEAIRGKLAQGKAINLIPEDAPSIELTPGEGMTGKYTAFINNLSEARFVSQILVHEDWIDPNYNGNSTTYILQVSEEQAKGQLLHHIRELVSVPVFTEWTDYLWQVGQTAMLIRNCQSGGGITMKAISLDATAWKRLITGGVANSIIEMPQIETSQ